MNTSVYISNTSQRNIHGLPQFKDMKRVSFFYEQSPSSTGKLPRKWPHSRAVWPGLPVGKSFWLFSMYGIDMIISLYGKRVYSLT